MQQVYVLFTPFMVPVRQQPLRSTQTSFKRCLLYGQKKIDIMHYRDLHYSYLFALMEIEYDE